MYLISIYFDEKTNNRIQQHINQVASKTGNMFMIDGNVPPHITVSAFETKSEEQVISLLESTVRKVKQGQIQFPSVGVFFPSVIYASTVYNEYLHQMSKVVFDAVKEVGDISISKMYRPFQWMPHVTIAKQLTREQMCIAFATLQNSFGMFEGNVVKIGLAKTNPYREIANWELLF